MSELFVRILNVGITGGWIALGILLLRPLLKRTPRWVLCLLWALVALRLLLPVEYSSSFSLLPSAQVIPTDIATSEAPAIDSGIVPVNAVVNPVLTEIAQPETNHMQKLMDLGVEIWLCGMAIIALYSIISYIHLAFKTRIKIKQQKRVYLCDAIDSPFILGVVFPKIYLPSGLDAQQREHVLAHEFAHLKRRDHLWKPLGFLMLCIYWFNPILWVAYILLCRDIEQACDEKVIKTMTTEEKARYATTLLECSVRRRMVTACPVAFGEVGVKTRIKGILSYKNPGFWVMVLSLVLCVVVAVCFMTNPLPCKHDYETAVLSAADCTHTGRDQLTCRKCDHSYVSRSPVLEHHYEDGEVLTQPTCTTTGVRNRVCTDCGHTVTEVMEMTAHIPGAYVVTEPSTCSAQGLATTNCTACGITMTAPVAVDPQAHGLQETVIKAVTCTKDGESIYTCQYCDFEEKCTHEKLGHQFKLVMGGHWCLFECVHCGAISADYADEIVYKGDPYAVSGYSGDYGLTVGGKPAKMCSVCGILNCKVHNGSLWLLKP